MLSTQSTNLFNSANTNQHHDLNESRILSDQQRPNDKTPTETAAEADQQDDDIYVMLDDSDEENSDNRNSNQESAQLNSRRVDGDDQANSQANDLADSRADSRSESRADSRADSRTDSRTESRTDCTTAADNPAEHPPDDDPIEVRQELEQVYIDQSLPEQQDTADDDSLFEIIDGILLYTFKSEEELRKFTEEDEAKKEKQNKFNKKEYNKAKYSARKSNGKGAATYSTGRRKSSIGKQQQQPPPSQNQSQDSAFISPELDDYLSKKFKNDRSRLSLDENASAENFSFNESFDSSFSTCRKSKGKPSKKSLAPEIVSVNETLSELDDEERMDNDVAYRRCIRSVEKAYNSVQEKMRGKFEPIPLDIQRVRLALGALHQNFISPSDQSIYSSSTFESSVKEEIVEPDPPEELDLDRARSNLENISKPRSSGEILFKIEPAEENNLKQIKLKQAAAQPQIEEEDKQHSKKKNRNEEEGYDITRIISKHSKRDIRLPARFHESGILVGSQWILPDYDENKSRTASNRKQTTNRKKSIGKSLKSDLANSSINSFETETTSPAASAVGQLKSEPLNPENLMSEDEDSTPSNELSTTANLASNSSSACNFSFNNESATSLNSANDDKSAKKRSLLKYLWRELFYANNSKRRAYYLERAILPRVNKYEVVQEGFRTIENLKKQVKKRNYCDNSLMTWQNKLKLTYSSIEKSMKSNGTLSAEELGEIEKTLNAYHNSMKKVDQVLSQADDLSREIDSKEKLAYNADAFSNNPPSTVSNSMNSSISSVASSQSSNHQMNGSISVKNNRIIINKPPPNYNSNSQAAPNVPFIHNSNGVSRVFNLKPEKPAMMMTKANGIRLSSTLLGQKERQKVRNKNFIVNGNAAQLNGYNLVPPPSTSSSYLTFNITRNGLQSSLPLCSNVLPPQNPINHPQLIHHTNPPLMPNSLSSANYVAAKYVPINLLKPNEITSHPNLSITESIASQQPIHQPVRNYAKILPKSNPNLVKLGTPISFMANHYLIPTTHNLVISPINNISSTITTTCPPGPTLSSVNFGPRTSVLPSLISKPNCESQQSILLKPNGSVKQSTTLK